MDSLNEAKFYYHSIVLEPKDWTNIYYWNKAFNYCKTANEAKSWLEFMKRKRVVKPNTFSYNHILKKLETPDEAIELLHELKEHGLEENIWTTIICIEKWTKNFPCAWALYKESNLGKNKTLFITLLKKVETLEQLDFLLNEFKEFLKPHNRAKSSNWRENSVERYIRSLHDDGILQGTF